MADAQVTTGSTTSEFKLSVVIIAIGTALDVAGIILGAIAESGAVRWPWLPAALVVVGTALSLFTTMGYQRSRTLLKVAALQSDAARAIGATVPLAQGVAAAFKPSPRAQPPPGVTSP